MGRGGDGELALSLMAEAQTETASSLLDHIWSPVSNWKDNSVIFPRAAEPFFSFLGSFPCSGMIHHEKQSHIARNEEILTTTVDYVLKFLGISNEHLRHDLLPYVSFLPCQKWHSKNRNTSPSPSVS